MKIKPQKSPVSLVAVLALILVAVGLLTYTYATKNWPFNKSESSVEESTSEDNNKNELAPQVKNETKNSDKNTEKQTSPTANQPVHFTPPKDNTDQANKKHSLTGVINFANVSEGNLIIRTTINQLESSGTCTLTVKSANSDRAITRTADIIANPSSSSCKGFSIPASQFSPGEWHITIKLKSGSDTGVLKKTISL